jgi:phosphoribosylformimino-5-aminoimidazole carboxamide ribotide isomerase
MDDVEKLSRLKVESVVVGKAIYENRVTIEDVKNWNLEALISI